MKLICMILTLLLSAATVFGGQVKKEDAFWTATQNKVQKLKLTSRKSNTGAATVAGVKGAKNDRTDIYWKGKEKKIVISEDELQKFNVAMELQSSGEKAKALKQFEVFLQEFPKSPLHADGTQAVQILKEELAASVSPVPTAGTPALPPVASTVPATAEKPAAK